MARVASAQRIASAFAVVCGRYGDIRRYAHERGLCRQSVYREATWVVNTLEGSPWRQQVAELGQQLRQSQQRVAELEARLAQAVVLDRDKQLGVVRELTDIVAAAAGDPTLTARTWVLITESPDGGWGVSGHANTGADMIAAARAELGAIAAKKSSAG